MRNLESVSVSPTPKGCVLVSIRDENGDCVGHDSAYALVFLEVKLNPQRKMKEYNLLFIKENGLWYIDLPNWPFSRSHLEMVEGADKLCEELSIHNKTDVKIIISDKEENVDHDIKLIKIKSDFLNGADYKVYGSILTDKCWICSVTLFVFGEYPNYIYIKKK